MLSSEPNPLEHLAAMLGIMPAFTDVWGRERRVEDETKRALVKAMGFEALNDAELAEHARALEAARAAEVLPPVIVIRESQAISLPLAIANVRLGWSIRTEDGRRIKGETTSPRLLLPKDLAPGYHRLDLPEMGAETALIVTPKQAFGVQDRVGEEQITGLQIPLYGLCTQANWGVGDYADLAAMATSAAAKGMDLLGINPVHALFPARPDLISPYSPSSRRFLNTLLIGIEDAPAWARLPSEMKERLKAGTAELKTAPLIDYPSVAAQKMPAFEALFRAMSDTEREAFETFTAEMGAPLQRHACFELLHEHFKGKAWQDWPAAYQNPTSTKVTAFAKAHRDRLRFYSYLQWLADSQLGRAQAQASDAGMRIGLYRDLAVGVAPYGAEAWAEPDTIIAEARLGAPPDDFSPKGQNWGLAPLSPLALREQAYRPFIELLRHNMRHAGALRIDHVIGLQQSFWLPADGTAGGAYVRYPLDDLLGLIALESHRLQTIVVGEDLGTVPEGLRRSLDRSGLLGCRVLYFERDRDADFRSAASYPKNSIASIGSHDLPTLKGFWAGRDIDWRDRLGLFPDANSAKTERERRARDRTRLLTLLQQEDLLPDGLDPATPPTDLPNGIVQALQRFLQKTPSRLALLQLEDLLGEVEQPNLPGTIDEHPNWRRRILLTLKRGNTNNKNE